MAAAIDISYNSVNDNNLLGLIDTIRKGMEYTIFVGLANQSPFNLDEWSRFLHLSERTMQRYKKENKTFDPIYTEKIIEITLLDKRGIEVFGSKAKFNTWLETENFMLGMKKPKGLLDSTFGISMLKDELTRIEYGILA